MIRALLANEPFGSQDILYCVFDICALLLITIIFFNYYFSKKVKNSASKLFLAMILFTISASLCDTLYLGLRYVFEAPRIAYNVFNILFYLSYTYAGIVFFVYTLAFIYEGKKLPRLGYIIANALFITSMLGIILAAVCEFGGFEKLGVAQAKDIYEYIIYASQLGAIIAAMVTTVNNRLSIRLHHRLNVYLFLILNLVAAVMQQMLRWHVCCFALAVADLLIYITLQRPEDEIDAVSGAFNAHTFSRRGNMRLNKGNPFLIFAMEINNMTVVNSSFGLNGGNQVLKAVAGRLKNILEKGQHLYRLIGARFAVMFNNQHEFDIFASRYKDILDEPISVKETELRITAIACVIAYPEVTSKLSEVEDLLRYYRNSINVSEDIITADKDALDKARRRELVDFAIQNAINNDTFEVYYQPIYSVADRSFSGCEALIRLKDEHLGFISPDEFIPIAEQNGKIIEVGRFVIEEVCRFIKQHNLQDLGVRFVDVNLSVIQCMHPEIIGDIERTLAKYQVPRSMVNLEITETASAQSYAMLHSKLNELHSNGFTISLDDFGTGFASVEYLINFPFDVVKLDKSLVWAYMSTKKYEPILQHYMPMLHSLGTRIVAEGVETNEMATALISLGCDFLQGYYYSRPIPKEEFLRFIKSNLEEQNLA